MSNTATTIPIQERIMHATIEAALAAFQAELPEVRKLNQATVEEEDGSLRSYRYAGLPDVSNTTLPALGRHGLSFVALPTMTVAGFVLAYELKHESGGSRTGYFPLPDPLETAPDEFGKRVSSARRHALTAVTGVAPVGREDEEPKPAPETAGEPEVPAADPEWLARAEAATTKKQEDAVWRDLRAAVAAGNATVATTDAVGALWKARNDAKKAEATATTEGDDK